ncbi:MAG: S8 family serine peptidase [Deltaproteobacteria bacterium]|nr:S8 family serine peptidase [Deltaproteobacteria bacterium]
MGPVAVLALQLLAGAGQPTERRLVELRAAPADEGPVIARIEAIGARRLGPKGGPIQIVELPAERLPALGGLAGVVEVSRRGRLGIALDRSGPSIGLPEVRDDLGLDGAGVLIGVIDTGADVLHPDLVRDDGRSRVELVIDLGEAPRGVFPEIEALAAAAVYGPEEIQAAVDSGDASAIGGRDRVGHGTHVASIAAGSHGLAPGATLIVVKASRQKEGQFEEADVVLAERFVFAYAAGRGMPAVVNLSLGGDDGAHDGSSLLERGLLEPLDEEPRGRLVVAAAGNGAYQDGHASAWLEGEASIALIVPGHGDLEEPPFVRLSVKGARGTTVEARAPDGTPRVTGVVSTTSGAIAVELADPEPGTWTLTLEGAGRADVWVAEANIVGALGTTPRFADHLDVGGQVMLPATAEGILAVGSYATRTSYRDRAGQWHDSPSLEAGAVSVFSARGPSAAGAPKPDLVAPGEAIIAALSSDTDPADPLSAFYRAWSPDGAVVDAGRAVLWGTSAAAAHVSGVAALLLSVAPDLDVAAVSDALRAASRPLEGRAWSVAHGHGLVDARAAVDAALGLFGSTIDPSSSAISATRDVLAPGEETRLLVVARDPQGRPAGPGHDVRVELEGTATLLDVGDLGHGLYEARWTPGPDALGGAFSFVASIDDRPLDRSATVQVAHDRRELGESLTVGGGGCSAGGGAPVAGVWLLALAPALLGRSRI